MTTHRHTYKFIGRTRWVKLYVFKCDQCHDVLNVHPSYLWKTRILK